MNRAGGATQVTVNQAARGATGDPLGSFSFNAGPTTDYAHRPGERLRHRGRGDVRAPGAVPNTATWTPNLSGPYEVYARWTPT